MSFMPENVSRVFNENGNMSINSHLAKHMLPMIQKACATTSRHTLAST